ncbi:hypothetical protein ACFWYW_59110 [Nonomuraea sp. NPDC059023]|uniref:hypothetical protein n=1 Tax=unclassified Nonomuraea TaxID=2593643 RepID=UPI0036A9F27A
MTLTAPDPPHQTDLDANQTAAFRPRCFAAYWEIGSVVLCGVPLSPPVDEGNQVVGHVGVEIPHFVEAATGGAVLARDYETKPADTESMIRLAMIANLAKRATG